MKASQQNKKSVELPEERINRKVDKVIKKTEAMLSKIKRAGKKSNN
jgi:hypothetical protein